MSDFQAIETDVEDPTPHEMELARNTTIQKLWDLTDTYNTLNKRAWGQRFVSSTHFFKDRFPKVPFRRITLSKGYFKEFNFCANSARNKT